MPVRSVSLAETIRGNRALAKSEPGEIFDQQTIRLRNPRHPCRTGARPRYRGRHCSHLCDIHLRSGGDRQAQRLRIRACIESDPRPFGNEPGCARRRHGIARLRQWDGGDQRRRNHAQSRRPRRCRPQSLRRDAAPVQSGPRQLWADIYVRRYVRRQQRGTAHSRKTPGWCSWRRRPTR